MKVYVALCLDFASLICYSMDGIIATVCAAIVEKSKGIIHRDERGIKNSSR